METRQGKIEGKSLLKARNQATYATFLISGMNYNTFDKQIIDDFSIGDFVEIEGTTNDKGFWQMHAMKIIPEPKGFQPVDAPVVKIGASQNGAKEYHLSPEEVKCRALECAIESIFKLDPTGKAVTTENILGIADKFVEWIYGN